MSKDEIAGPTEPGAAAVTYATYLKVNELLSLQQPLTSPPQHDETLFIIIHQVYELWFKQLLHEVGRAAIALEQGQVLLFGRIAQRMVKIQEVLTHQVDVLETMTPVDFNRFRDNLNPASGFQSFQFRVMEFRLGARDVGYLKFHVHDAAATSALQTALATPSLYDQFLHLLANRGFAIPKSVLGRDVTLPYTSTPEVLAAVLRIYRESEQHYDLYSTLEALINIDEGLLLWRQRHVAMVERMIGTRRGTGGSSGVRYLANTLSKRFFPEIWEARNFLGDGESSYGNGKSSSKAHD